MEVTIKVGLLERFNRRQQIERWLLEDQHYQEQLGEKPTNFYVIVKKPSQLERLETLTKWKVQDELWEQAIIHHKNNPKSAEEMLEELQKIKNITNKKRSYELGKISNESQCKSKKSRTDDV